MEKIKKEGLSFVRGTVKFDEPVSRHTTFRIGGPADVWISPADEDDLLEVLRYAAENRIDVFMIGGGSKLLVGDKGIKGFAIHLDAPAFAHLDFEGETCIAGCGVKIGELVAKAADNNLGGLEFFAGIPGTLGGAIMINAGWPTRAIGDLVEEITAIKDLKRIKLGKDDLKFSYRSSNLAGHVLLSAKLKLETKPKVKVEGEVKKNLEKKRNSQELGYPSVGSIFLNPSGNSPAWELIERSGLRGRAVGDAAVSEKHVNFIINRGKATAADVRRLIEEIQKKVFEDHQIMLKLEVKVIGEF